MLTATAVIGLMLYPDMPDPVPVHWGAGGEPDRFEPKNLWSALMSVWLGFGTLIFMTFMMWLVTKLPMNMPVNVPRELEREYRERCMPLVQKCLALTCFLLSLLFAAMSLEGWLEIPGPVFLVSTLVFLLAMTIAVFRLVKQTLGVVPDLLNEEHRQSA